jgi:hypothetical protein
MVYKFEAGDKVRIIQRKKGNPTGLMPGWDEPNGNVGEIGYVIKCSSNGRYMIHSRPGASQDDLRDYYGYFDEDDLELVERLGRGISDDPSVKAVRVVEIEAAELRGQVRAYEKLLIGRHIDIGA